MNSTTPFYFTSLSSIFNFIFSFSLSLSLSLSFSSAQMQMESPPNNNNNNDIIRRRSSSSSSSASNSSPEFEFFTSFSQQATLHSADELFSGGILLPLHRLTTEDHPPDHSNNITNAYSNTNKQQDTMITEPPPGSDLKPTPSKRWKDIFKKNPDTKNHNKDDENKKKKKDRNSAATAVGTPAELNINLWPFSRSRSAGTGGSKPRMVVGNRKVSSAPCSRSNSTGDKYRKWPSSPGRPGGVHLGRSSPVWQAKRLGQSRSLHDTLVRNTVEKSSRPAKNGTAGAGGNGKVLNINVPTCIGYRQRMSCRSDVVIDNNNAGRVAGGNDDVTPVNAAAGEGGATGLFNLRSLFSKKVF